MTRFPIRAGNASAATSLTIAFARLADVIVDINLLYTFRDFLSRDLLLRSRSPYSRPSLLIGRFNDGDCSNAPQRLRSEPRDLFPNSFQVFFVHSWLNLVYLDAWRNVRRSTQRRLGATPARNPSRQRSGFCCTKAARYSSIDFASGPFACSWPLSARTISSLT